MKASENNGRTMEDSREVKDIIINAGLKRFIATAMAVHWNVKPDECAVVLLESTERDGFPVWVAYSYEGLGYEISLEEEVPHRNRNYDEKIVDFYTLQVAIDDFLTGYDNEKFSLYGIKFVEYKDGNKIWMRVKWSSSEGHGEDAEYINRFSDALREASDNAGEFIYNGYTVKY